MRHIRSGLIGRHVFEQLAPPPEDPDAHGTKHLVAGEHQEVAAKAAHIKRNMWGGLRGINEHVSARTAGPRADLCGRIDVTRDVGDMAETDEACPLRELPVELIE